MIDRSDRRSPAVAARTAFVMALVVFGVVFIANSWVGDDAFISFRVSDNIIHGYGPRWNVAERVQAFTNPLWTFLLAGAGYVSGELFYTSMALSFALCVVTLAVAWRWLDRRADRWLLVALLVSSKAFIDYSSSGLEYPVSYLLLACFVAALIQPQGLTPDARPPLVLLTFIASLSFVNRADTVLLYLPALLWLLGSRLRTLNLTEVRRLFYATSPAWGWLLFSLIYYGFPFPNTYYAKAASGIPSWLYRRQGLAYVASSFRFDAITLSTIAAAVLAMFVTKGVRQKMLALGAFTYVLYTISVGGDFMAGRFFALPFLMAVLLLANLPKRRITALAGVGLLVVLNVVNPLAPMKTIPAAERGLDIGWNWRLQNGVKDERGAIASGVSPLTYEVFRRMPDNLMAREGRSLSASPEKVLVHPWIGVTGFYAGPTKYIIDPNGLSDPFLARLPVPPDFYFAFWVSHYTRALPDGYLDSRRSGTNLLTDHQLRRYYDKVLNVTTGPIFSAARWRDILDLNWRMRDFKDKARSAQRLNTTVRVSNPLFWTDAGTLDQRTQLITATGKAGYLLIGPGIPLRAGTYEVRWTGTRAPGNPDAGYVQVCSHDCADVVARTMLLPVVEDGVLARAVFTISEDVRDAEFRLYVNENSGVTLEAITISQK
jgi:arabinofuranosyltransferase